MLKGFQKKFLRGLAHGMKPVVFIGQRGMTETVENAVEEALNAHELIKIKFNETKEKDRKMEIAAKIERRSDCQLVGLIGHVAIFYRPHRDPEKRKIIVPTRNG